MDFSAYQSRLSQLSARLNLMVFLVFGLLVSNLVLSILATTLWKHHTVEITPYSGSPAYFKSETAVDSHYLSLMSENFIHSRLNVTPETVEVHHKRLLDFVAPTAYPDMLKALNREAHIVKSKKMSSSFEMMHVQVNQPALSVKIEGILRRNVGLRALKDMKTAYRLQFQYTQGRLNIVSFVQEKKHENA